jgi:hypothetical protein
MDAKGKAAPRSERETAEVIGHGENATLAYAAQAPESPLMILVKTWLRCGVTDRALFLADVRAGNPNLWKAVERDAGGPGQ